MRVLVIDDSVTILETTRAALEHAGFEVVTTGEPARPPPGLEPDLILVDVNMREVFGDDVVRFFKERTGVTAPILLYSSAPEGKLQKLTEDSGASGYICKSWGYGKMVAKVKEILAVP